MVQEMSEHIGLLKDFPEVQALGQNAVQGLCEWVRTQAAREGCYSTTS